ncbi:MAG: outer membrane PBP1 activator LpoA protein [Bacteroidia bacterium]|jgi:outer membrane PBP1 activator LpoA protein
MAVRDPRRTHKSMNHSMTQTPFRSGAALKTCTLVLCAAVLWGCGSQTRQPDTQQDGDPTTGGYDQPAGTIALALPVSGYDAQFHAADSALDRGDWMAASLSLPDREIDTLSSFEGHYLRYLQARMSYARGAAKSAFEQISALLDSDIVVALRYRALAFRAHAHALALRQIDAAWDLHNILQLGELENAPAWRRELWRTLQQASIEELKAADALAPDAIWEGWLRLALASRETRYVRRAQLQSWKMDYPQHPVASQLPGGLESLLANDHSAQQVALLLPLSGRLAPAGKAVLDGYLAAHFDSTGPTAQLQVLDSTEFPSASAAYDHAVASGAGLLIGPLNKLAVTDLGTLANRPIPILALNRTDSLLPASGSALVQFSLAPEDEAANIAELAFGDGGRRAIILSPQGSWGDSTRAALSRRWEALGGQIASTASFFDQEDYSPGIRRVLGLADSQRRAAIIDDVLVDELEFSPRRRQDVDVIFLLTRTAAQARALKPLLAFHYAGDLPVYTTTNAYSGIPQPGNRDLNGIQLVETPWLLGANTALRVAVAAGDSASENYPRLNAMGADAFLLQREFARLSAGPDALLRGNTGLLSMDPQLRIERKLLPATFDGGVIQAR